MKGTNRLITIVGQCTFFARSGRQFSNRHGASLFACKYLGRFRACLEAVG
jgi:hypothetical protein